MTHLLHFVKVRNYVIASEYVIDLYTCHDFCRSYIRLQNSGAPLFQMSLTPCFCATAIP